MSIFISIASYRDPLLEMTIRSAIDHADNPEQLYFSVVSQEIEREQLDLSWVPNLSLIKIHPKFAKGAGYARYLAMQSYDNQDYYLQIDSHTLFEDGWDTTCISEIKKAQEIAENNKIILSYFPPPFHIENKKEISFPKLDKERKPYPTRQVPFLNKRKEWTALRIDFNDKKLLSPEESSTVLAGFIFSLGSLVKEVPYDPEISFFGEEICFAMRAWTRGWDIYSPSKIILYHFYSRGDYKKIWKDKPIREKSWTDIELASRKKQMSVLCGIEKGIYGSGDIRSIEQYEDFCGHKFKEFYSIDFY